jgi:hypothetical protein
MGGRPRVRQESSPPGKQEYDVLLLLTWGEKSLARLAFPNPLETGDVRPGEDTVRVRAATEARSWDGLRSLVHGCLERAGVPVDIPEHTVLAGRPWREQCVCPFQQMGTGDGVLERSRWPERWRSSFVSGVPVWPSGELRVLAGSLLKASEALFTRGV